MNAVSVALVIGGAVCVHRDVENALRLFSPDATFVINDMIPNFNGRVDYAITLHPDKLANWLRERRIRKLSDPGEVWSHKRTPLVNKVTKDWSGSSGLFAVKVALFEEGFSGVVLAGVPMRYQDRHFLRPEEWIDASHFKSAWIKHLPEIANAVRSMSGWTAEHLGTPTPSWLESVKAAKPDGHKMPANYGDGQWPR